MPIRLTAQSPLRPRSDTASQRARRHQPIGAHDNALRNGSVFPSPAEFPSLYRWKWSAAPAWNGRIRPAKSSATIAIAAAASAVRRRPSGSAEHLTKLAAIQASTAGCGSPRINSEMTFVSTTITDRTRAERRQTQPAPARDRSHRAAQSAGGLPRSTGRTLVARVHRGSPAIGEPAARLHKTSPASRCRSCSFTGATNAWCRSRSASRSSVTLPMAPRAAPQLGRRPPFENPAEWTAQVLALLKGY
jgi:hypothetical protein